MASSSKKKTTFAKMNRENAVRERRLRKQEKKEARKLLSQRAPQPEAGEDAAVAEPGDRGDLPAL